MYFALPSDEKNRVRLDSVCRTLNLSHQEWFEKVLRESENEVTVTSSQQQENQKSNVQIVNILDCISVLALDQKWRITYINDKSMTLLPIFHTELLGCNIWEAIPGARGTLLETCCYRAVKEQVPVIFEFNSLQHKDIWLEISAYPTRYGLVIYYQDITEQKLTSEKLIKSQREVINLLESMTDCFFSLDYDWRFTYINKPAEASLGKEGMRVKDLLGKRINEVFKLQPLAVRNYEKAMKERCSLNFEVLSEALGNKWVDMSIYPAENGIICFYHDISARKKTEKEMARLERLKLISQVAAGIAHEVRNPMTTVRGFLQLFHDKPEHAGDKEMFDLMISELDRANSIITDFLSLANDKHIEWDQQKKNLNNIIIRLKPLLVSDSINYSMFLECNLLPIPEFDLNEKEITQLILNLVRNGFESMEKNKTLTIETCEEEQSVVLKIRDEGKGIEPENLSKLGIPFYTTKVTGTGLGLATCYSIASRHNANIEIDTGTEGSTFSVKFKI